MFSKQADTFDGRAGYAEDGPELSWIYRGTANDAEYAAPANNPNPREQAGSYVPSSANAGGQVVPGGNKAAGGRLTINNRFLQILVPVPIIDRDYTAPPSAAAAAKGVLGQNESNKGAFETGAFESNNTKDKRERIKNPRGRAAGY